MDICKRCEKKEQGKIKIKKIVDKQNCKKL